MRKMFPSEALEKVYEEGVWEIDSGSIALSKNLKSLESGYQYKIYLNVKGDASTISRVETEIGISKSFITFIDNKSLLYPTNPNTIDGGSSYRVELYKNDAITCGCILKFTGTLTAKVYFRYLITRSKIYW